MNTPTRILSGALAGFGGTVALSLLRETSRKAGIISDTAPAQVIARAKELGLLDGLSDHSEELITLAAHYAYGTAAGATFGLLRRDYGDLAEEMATGAALGILAWAAGWAVWLPLAGVHSSPWNQSTPKVLLPVIDHAAFGAAFGFLYVILREDPDGEGGLNDDPTDG
ncbi:hypothetical protein [Rubrobacter indicoceani]|uniref:hypothetical protein n=1 Tax=Rubrobacter indicoceani TaxID=2051957 RepID=UPI000E5B4A9A|nr:hypothetical protein [Rubrobacter indicoceani]